MYIRANSKLYTQRLALFPVTDLEDYKPYQHAARVWFEGILIKDKYDRYFRQTPIGPLNKKTENNQMDPDILKNLNHVYEDYSTATVKVIKQRDTAKDTFVKKALFESKFQKMTEALNLSKNIQKEMLEELFDIMCQTIENKLK